MVFYVDHGGHSSNDITTQISFEVDFQLLIRLPEQLLVEILIRLPSQSVCRFKAVCKEWSRLITTKYFVSRYLDHRCHNTPKSFTLVVALKNAEVVSPTSVLNYVHPVTALSNHPLPSKLLEIESFNSSLQYLFDNAYKTSYVPLPNEQQQQCREIYVEASCHDLLVLSDYISYCIVNMHTAKFIMLPPVRQCFGTSCYRKSGLVCYHDYGDRCCNFKLILVPFFTDFRGIKRFMEHSQYGISIYSSETGEWSVVNVSWYPLKLNVKTFDTPIISHDKMLYWVNNQSLVSLDPCDAKLSLCKVVELPPELPPELVPQIHSWLLLGVCCGRIRLVGDFYEAGNLVLHVWDLDNNELWLPSHKIVLGNLDWFVLLAIHPYDSDVIFARKKNVIYLFNMRTDALDEYHKITVEDGEERSIIEIAIVALHRWFPTPIPTRNWPTW